VFALPTSLVAAVADRRARGQSWSAIAAAIAWDEAVLRSAVRHDPRYEAALGTARREVEEEAEAELIHTLRQHLHNPETALPAATLLAKYLSDRRRDTTRLAVEQLRRSTRPASPELPAAPQPPPEAEPRLTADEEQQAERAFWRRQYQVAQEAAQPGAEVYLWGGDHPIGDTPPTAADTRLLIVSDMTIPGRHVYWAMRYPPPTDPETGPFPASPLRPMPEAQPCPPELAVQPPAMPPLAVQSEASSGSQKVPDHGSGATPDCRKPPTGSDDG
jgi:hypothetical protein